MAKCHICKCNLYVENIARWDIPGTDKHGTIRTDSNNNFWCQKCTDEFDEIDWSN